MVQIQNSKFIMMEISIKINKTVINPTKWQRILGWMYEFQDFELPKLQLISIKSIYVKCTHPTSLLLVQLTIYYHP